MSHPLLSIALRAAREAANVALRAYDRPQRLKVGRKGSNDFVTDVDTQAELAAIEVIRHYYPEHSVLSEECGMLAGTDRDSCWVLDPLDGTTNFIHGLPHFAVSLVLVQAGELSHAVIADPLRREEFTASRGAGAHMNGQRIHASSCSRIDLALLATGTPTVTRQHRHADAYFECLKSLAARSSGIRRFGSAVLDLAYVACGRLDGFWEIGLSPWDLAAGVLIIEEAGGLVSDFSGGQGFLESGDIVCAAPRCFRHLLRAVKVHLGDVNTAPTTSLSWLQQAVDDMPANDMPANDMPANDKPSTTCQPTTCQPTTCQPTTCQPTTCQPTTCQPTT